MRLWQTEPVIKLNSNRRPSFLYAGSILALMAAFAGATQAGTIVSETSGNFFSGNSTNSWGESFTTPGGGPWNSIGFNFYADFSGTPIADGTAFLLNQVYAGTPGALSSSTPGFLAASTSTVASQYIFDPSFVLQSNTKYFLYTDGTFVVTGLRTSFTGEAYFATGSSSAFGLLNGPFSDLNFLVSGSAIIASVPEPSTIVVTLPLLGLFFWRKRAA